MSGTASPVARSVVSPVASSVVGDVAGGGGSSTNSVEAQQFYDRLFTPPDTTWEARYGAFIDALVAAGVWAKLDCLYVFCANYESDALCNLKQASYQAGRDESAGAATWTQNSGYSAGGVAKRVSSNFNPSTAISANYTRNDACVFAWSGTATQSNISLISAGSASPAESADIALYPRWSDNKTYFRVNQAADAGPTYSGDSSGLFLMQRTGAGAIEVFRSNTSIGTAANASTALVNANILVRCAFLTRIFGIGASLNSDQRTALQTASEELVAEVVGSTP